MNDTARDTPQPVESPKEQIARLQEELRLACEMLEQEKEARKEYGHLLNDAKHELRRVYRENELLAAKVSTMELFRAAMAPRVHDSQAMGVDLAWRIEKALSTVNHEA